MEVASFSCCSMGSRDCRVKPQLLYHPDVIGQIVSPRLPVRVGKKPHRSANNALQHLFAGGNVSTSCAALHFCQDGMTGGMSTYFHSCIVHHSNLLRGHHEIVRQHDWN